MSYHTYISNPFSYLPKPARLHASKQAGWRRIASHLLIYLSPQSVRLPLPNDRYERIEYGAGSIGMDVID